MSCLEWCRNILNAPEYEAVLGQVKNWKADAWKNGLAHCALIHRNAAEHLDPWERFVPYEQAFCLNNGSPEIYIIGSFWLLL